MNSRAKNILALVALGISTSLLLPTEKARAQDRLQVVTSLTTYADMAREIGGDRAEVTAAGILNDILSL